MIWLATVIVAANLISSPLTRDTSDCKVEPASQWAPQGYICPPIYGTGDASRYEGTGVARNDCTWPFTDCPTIRITSLLTSRSIVVTPVTWCMCWVGVNGPAGETERIVDLDPSAVAALGLDWNRGLFRVRVEPVNSGAALPKGASIPDTAMMP